MQLQLLNFLKKSFLLISALLYTNYGIAQDLAQQEFSTVRVSGAVQVTIKQGESSLVKVEGNAEDTSKIKTKIENGILSIQSKGNGKFSEKARVAVTVKNLERLILSGASEVNSSGELIQNNINIESSGAGDAHLELKSTQIKAEVSGAGNLHLSGTTGILQSKVSGAGELKAYALSADSVVTFVSGSGTAKVNANKYISASVSGAGSVIYKGEPTDRNVEISGAGSVRQARGENEIEINESLKIDRRDGDTTRFKLGDRRIMIFGDEDGKDTVKKHDEVKSIWSGIEVGVNGYLTPGGSSDFPKKYNFLELNYKKSLCINLNVWEKNIKLYKNYVALTTGAGLEFNRYFFDNNSTLQGLNDTVSAYVSGLDFSKNCLKASYVTVPLLLELNSNKVAKKSFHLAAGIVGAYNLTTKLKQVYELNNKEYKNKVKSDFNLNPFKIAATVRLGYSRFNVFATYGLTPFFQKKATAPDLTAFTVGVTLLHFD